jgi:hypothetical protein
MQGTDKQMIETWYGLEKRKKFSQIINVTLLPGIKFRKKEVISDFKRKIDMAVYMIERERDL